MAGRNPGVQGQEIYKVMALEGGAWGEGRKVLRCPLTQPLSQDCRALIRHSASPPECPISSQVFREKKLTGTSPQLKLLSIVLSNDPPGPLRAARAGRPTPSTVGTTSLINKGHRRRKSDCQASPALAVGS